MKKDLPFYARDNETRTILYSDMKINDSNYSVADICFICDTTGSMDRYIDPIKEFLTMFLNEISKLIYGRPRVAFIAYKDRDALKNGKDQIESKGFTTKYGEMEKFIKRIKCEGGEDTCEDIVTPLRVALKLDWSSDLNYVYLITDAPTHGRRYHKGECLDDHPNDDETKLLEKLVSHYRKSKINLIILRCNKYVDEMIRIIKEYYDSPASELRIIKIDEKDCHKKGFMEHFIVSLINSFKESLTNTRNKDVSVIRYAPSGTREVNFRKIRKKAPEPEEVQPELEMLFESSFKGKVNTGSIKGLAFDKREYAYSIEIVPSAEIQCKISGVIIATGVFVNCHSLHVGESTNYVAKIPKKIATKAKDLFPDIEGTLLTKVLVDKFNFLLKQAEKDKGNIIKHNPIRVLPLSIIESLEPEKSKGLRFFLAQQFLDGEYVKFSNNYGWKTEDKDSCALIAQAFSHFTYEYSMGVIMVTDIQGVRGKSGEIIITDPAIHSFLYKEQFGQTNHGKLGIIRFFMTHECNDYCKKLHLIHPKSIDDATIKSMKEENKAGKALNHLYERFEPDIKKWRKKIQSFDPNLDPTLDSGEEESGGSCKGTTHSRLLRVSISPGEE